MIDEHQGVLGEYEAWLRAAGRPDTTIGLRCYHIRRLGRAVPDFLTVTTDDLIRWLAGQQWEPATRRSYRSSLRTFYGWAALSGRISHNPAQGLPAVRPTASLPRPAAEHIITTAIASAPDRVQLMILLQAKAGLRRGEVARVHTRDLLEDLDGWSLHVHGKGRRDRVIPLTSELAETLRGMPPGWVFPSPAGGHLTPAHAGKLVSTALGPGTVPHQLRHRFATRTFGVGQNILVVQQLLGHAKLDTTMIYTQVGAGSKRRIVDAAA